MHRAFQFSVGLDTCSRKAAGVILSLFSGTCADNMRSALLLETFWSFGVFILRTRRSSVVYVFQFDEVCRGDYFFAFGAGMGMLDWVCQLSHHAMKGSACASGEVALTTKHRTLIKI